MEILDTYAAPPHAALSVVIPSFLAATMPNPPSPVTMASVSPMSSPEKMGNTRRQLTPRSKVKAMLAAIDDDLDQGAALSPIEMKPKRPVLAAISGNLQKPESDDEQADDDDDEDSPIVPRGRLAARLNAQTEQDNSDSDGQEDENVYARVKKQLLSAAKKSQEKSRVHGERSDASATASASNEASPTPRSPRKSLPDSAETPKKTPPKKNSSPGLFLTSQSETGYQAPNARDSPLDDEDSDLPGYPATSNRFSVLLARKEAEREAKHAEDHQKKAEKFAKRREFEETLSRDASASSGGSDDELAEKILTQSARPTRKASKKALEEMNRETQRMKRNMQLAHQARTKKKISKDSLLARFNFRTSTRSVAAVREHPSSSTIPSSAAPSDAENAQAGESPPTSPIEPHDDPLPILTTNEQNGTKTVRANHALELHDEDLPEMADILNAPRPLDKVKGKAVGTNSPATASPTNKRKRYNFTQRPVQVRLSMSPSKSDAVDLDSESDFEKPLKQKIKKSRFKSSKLDAFHRLPAGKIQDAHSLLNLRALAHLNNPDDTGHGRKASMNISEMQTLLQKRARMQALEERKAKIDDLKARGILVQTAEEREKDQAEVEDLLEKARREAGELQQKEKKAAKKEKIANGETGDLDTSDDDEDYNDGGDDDADVELSGSDEEEAALAKDENGEASSDDHSEREEDEEDVELDEEERKQNSFLDEQAEEDDEEEEAVDEDEDTEAERDESRRPRQHRTKTAIEDDEDDDLMGDVASKTNVKEVNTADEVQAETTNIPQFPPMFGAQEPNYLSLGMTQAFAGTMADTQGQTENDADEEQDSMAFFEAPPEPDFPLFAAENSQHMVQDSQTGNEDVQDTGASHQINLQFSQSQLQHDMRGATQLQREATQLTEIPDPTQDAGFVLLSPAPERFASVPPSTVDTVIVPEAQEDDSPIAKKRGRLVRREAVPPESDGDDSPVKAKSPAPRDVFTAMKEKRKKEAQDAFNKKKSEAKGMVEEQAQESEDEYAGLGGASDDESGGEEDQYVKEMMDHGEVDVDEGQLAALYA